MITTLPILFYLSIIILPIIILIKSIKKHNAEISKINNIIQQQDNYVKYCSICGAELHKQAIICTKCGCSIKQQTKDSNSSIFNVLSYISPLIGLILYSIYKDDKPIKAQGCKRFALTSLITLAAILLSAIVFLLLFSLYFYL